MPRMLITHAMVVLPDKTLGSQTVVIADGRIEKVCPDGACPSDADDIVFDAKGLYLAPGFIDLHTHGVHEFSLDGGADHLKGACRVLPGHGVTGFLPTLAPRPKGKDAEYLALLASCDTAGARALGFHLEGPFLTLTGALPPEAIGEADPERVRMLQEAASGLPLIFSIAPDFENIGDLLPLMRKSGPVFMTHTAADVAQTQRAIEAGARHATHFYDVFPCPPVRDGGVRPCGAVEAILADERVTVDFILDGEHVDPIAVKMALACKGPGGVSLVTDAQVGSGLPPARYQWPGGEVEFRYPGGPARMTENSRAPGGLSGSGLTMDLAVRNAVKMLSVELPQAVRMASLNPAAVLGLDDRKGKIAEGFDADLVLLDENLNVVRTWIGGEVFSA